MATVTQLQGAGTPLIISEVEYQARTLTDRDYTEIDEYIKSEIVNIAYTAMRNNNLLPSDRQEMLSASLLAATKVNWFTDEGNHIMSSAKGMARLAWQMIKHFQPKLLFSKFLEEFKKTEYLVENMQRTQQVFEDLNYVKEDKEVESSEDSTENTKS